ncbi:glycoside hydrolase family 31 protein [Candidatus Chlorohelix sp.]|uniref:glycoside hydrolase family 31 protein n=1 Tax=Candidatus Chlorohelix sp. TaxID=3139201 RepID=UPI00304E7B61
MSAQFLAAEKPGKLKGFWKQGQSLFLDYEGAALSITTLDKNMVRFRLAQGGAFATRRSWSVTRPDEDFPAVPYTFITTPDGIELTTEALLFKLSNSGAMISILNKQGLLISEDSSEGGVFWEADGKTIWHKTMPEDEHYYGFGERSGLLDKRGRRYTCWTTDPWQYTSDHGPGADSLYQAIPFFMALRQETGCYGIYLNNTHRTAFDMGNPRSNQYSIEVEGGEMDYYFIYGPKPAQVLERYTLLTGRMPMPPRWALGYHQSRWSYKNEQIVHGIANQFREKSIPADVIHLDIDYMDEFRVFTWNKSAFPNPAKLVSDLNAQGFKVVTIIDPGVKCQPEGGYHVYSEGSAQGYFITNPSGTEYTGCVWPGTSVFPDFTRTDVRKWWGDQHKELLDAGVKGIWNDMNEPAISQYPFGTPQNPVASPPLDAPMGDQQERITFAEGKNVYGLLMDRATHEAMLRFNPNERPFMLTRSGAAGIQRYSAVWSGDNLTLWEHLEMSIAEICNWGLSGVGFSGVDIGGFGGHGTPELFARWIQLGAFYPFSRGHSVEKVSQKEPWTWGSEVEEISRRALTLRYRLMHYLYALFYTASQTGAPIWQPLFYQFSDDATTYQISDQVMVGHAIMLAPICRPGQTTRAVYMPEGVWYDFWSDERLTKPGYRLVEAELDTIPMFMRGGTIVPFGTEMQYSDEKPLDLITLEVYPDANGNATGALYEDDGHSFGYQRGDFCLTRFQCFIENGKAKISAQRQGQYAPTPRAIEIWVHSEGEARSYQLPHDTGNWQIEV